MEYKKRKRYKKKYNRWKLRKDLLKEGSGLYNGKYWRFIDQKDTKKAQLIAKGENAYFNNSIIEQNDLVEAIEEDASFFFINCKFIFPKKNTSLKKEEINNRVNINRLFFNDQNKGIEDVFGSFYKNVKKINELIIEDKTPNLYFLKNIINYLNYLSNEIESLVIISNLSQYTYFNRVIDLSGFEKEVVGTKKDLCKNINNVFERMNSLKKLTLSPQVFNSFEVEPEIKKITKKPSIEDIEILPEFLPGNSIVKQKIENEPVKTNPKETKEMENRIKELFPNVIKKCVRT